VDGGGAGRFWRVRQVYKAELVALIALAPVARVPGAGSLPMPAYPRSAEIGDGSAVISGHRGRGSTMACNCIHRVHGPPTLSVGPRDFCRVKTWILDWLVWLPSAVSSARAGEFLVSSDLRGGAGEQHGTHGTGDTEVPKAKT